LAKDDRHGSIRCSHLEPPTFAVGCVLRDLEAERLRPESQGAVLILDLDLHLVDSPDHLLLL
jgi:hypothetical protein